MYCINCGKEVVGEYKYCINCGTEIVNKKQEKEKNIEKKVIYKDEEKINSLVENNIIVPLVFGILLATILSIVCISSFNKETEKVLKYEIYKINKYSL